MSDSFLFMFLKTRSDFVAGKRGTVAKHPCPIHNSLQRGLYQGVLDFPKMGCKWG